MTLILVSGFLLCALFGVIAFFTGLKKTGMILLALSAGLLAVNILFALLIMNSDM